MSFTQNWIDGTVHCVDVTGLSSAPDPITAGVPAIFTATVKSSDTFANAGSQVTLTSDDGETPVIGVLSGPVNGVYTAVFPSVTYAAAGIYQAVVDVTTDEPQTYQQQFQVIVN